MCMGKDGGKLGHVFVEMMSKLGQNCGGEGSRIGSSLWTEGGIGSSVNVCGERVGEGDMENAFGHPFISVFTKFPYWKKF